MTTSTVLQHRCPKGSGSFAGALVRAHSTASFAEGRSLVSSCPKFERNNRQVCVLPGSFFAQAAKKPRRRGSGRFDALGMSAAKFAPSGPVAPASCLQVVWCSREAHCKSKASSWCKPASSYHGQPLAYPDFKETFTKVRL